MELRDKNGLTEAEFLAGYKQKDYPRPSFTADAVVISGAAEAAAAFARDGACSMRVLLVKRGGHPYLGCWAFPGGFVNPDEDADAAVARELAEETGVTSLPAIQLGVYSAPSRDPRGWTVSAAYLSCVGEDVTAHAGDDAARALWCDLQVSRCEDGRIAVAIDADGERLTCLFAVSDPERPIARARVDAAEGLAFDHADMLADACVVLLGLSAGR